MASGIALWLVITIPVGLFIGLWGYALRRTGRGIGNVLLAWSVAAPLLPPILTVATRLWLGDSAPSEPHEAWPYYGAVALYSFGAVIVVTPLLLVIVLLWVLAEVTIREEPP